MSLLGGIADVVGFRNARERQEQAGARARIVAVKPEMADLKENRVVMSFALRAAWSYAIAASWAAIVGLMYGLSQAELEAWSQILCLIGMVMALPMAMGNVVTATIHALRATFTRFDWIAFEQMMNAAGESTVR